MTKLYYKFLLWKYSRSAKYYDNLTGGQSDYYHNKIKEVKLKLISISFKSMGINIKNKNNEYKLLSDVLDELGDKYV